MPIFASEQPRATRVDFQDEMLVVYLEDGRIIQVPLEFFPRLRDATEAQRADWRLIGRGVGLHWKSLDEDLSVRGLLWPEPQPIASFNKPVALEPRPSTVTQWDLELGDDEAPTNGFGKPTTWEENR